MSPEPGDGDVSGNGRLRVLVQPRLVADQAAFDGRRDYRVAWVADEPNRGSFVAALANGLHLHFNRRAGDVGQRDHRVRGYGRHFDGVADYAAADVEQRVGVFDYCA